MTLGERVRTARLAMGLTQAQLAGQDFTVSFICKIERGTVKPSIRSLKLLARKLQRPLGYFVDGASSSEEAYAHLELGRAYLSHGEISKASEQLSLALEAGQGLGDPVLAAEATVYLADAALARGELHRAGRLLGEARPVLQRHHRFDVLTKLTLLEGHLRMARHDTEGALKAYIESLDWVEKGGVDAVAKAEILTAIADAKWRLGAASEAHSIFLETLRLDEESLDLKRASLQSIHDAQEHQHKGDLEKTRVLLERARLLMHLHQIHQRIAQGYKALGRLQASQGLWKEASRSFERSALMFSRLEAHAEGHLATLELAQSLFADGETGKALRVCQRLLLGSLNEAARAEAHHLMGRIFRARRQWRKAQEHMEMSLALFEEAAAPDRLASVSRDIALLLVEQGKEQEAIPYFRKAALALSEDSPWPLEGKRPRQGRSPL